MFHHSTPSLSLSTSPTRSDQWKSWFDIPRTSNPPILNLSLTYNATPTINRNSYGLMRDAGYQTITHWWRPRFVPSPQMKDLKHFLMVLMVFKKLQSRPEGIKCPVFQRSSSVSWWSEWCFRGFSTLKWIQTWKKKKQANCRLAWMPQSFIF